MSLERFAPTLSWEVPPVAGVFEANGPSTLDLNFLGGTLDSSITFARASSATYFDVTGTRQTASTDVARFDYDPVTHVLRGLLMEEQRTNSLKNSGTPATQTTGSLGTGTYVLWVEGSGSATSSAGTATGTGFGAASAGSPNTFVLTGAGTVVVTVSGSLTIFQLEKGAFATSYIATTAATATRAKDVATAPVSTSWFNPAVGTLAAEAMVPVTSTPVTQSFAEIGDATNNNRFFIDMLLNSSFLTVAYTAAGVTAVNATTTGLITAGTAFKAALAVSAAGTMAALNGANVGIGNIGGSPLAAATILGIGNRASAVLQLNGYIRRVRYWPRLLNIRELQEVTT